MLVAIRHCSILIDFGPLITFMRLMFVEDKNEVHDAGAEGVGEFNKYYRQRVLLEVDSSFEIVHHCMADLK